MTSCADDRSVAVDIEAGAMSKPGSTSDHEIKCTVLTADEVLKLADRALEEGRRDSAIRFINIAYALFDASQSTSKSDPDQPDH